MNLTYGIRLGNGLILRDGECDLKYENLTNFMRCEITLPELNNAHDIKDRAYRKSTPQIYRVRECLKTSPCFPQSSNF